MKTNEIYNRIAAQSGMPPLPPAPAEFIESGTVPLEVEVSLIQERIEQMVGELRQLSYRLVIVKEKISKVGARP